MKTAISIVIVLLSFFTASGQKLYPKKDLINLTGKWEGTLTYLDYQTGKPYSMPANIEVSSISSNDFLYANIYPDEPKANSVDTLKVSTDGKVFDNNRISSVKRNKNNITIITEIKGKDGNDAKEALLKTTYFLQPNKFSIIKEVKFVNSNVWIKRHEYLFNKKQ